MSNLTSTTEKKCRICLSSSETTSICALSHTSLFMLRSICPSFNGIAQSVIPEQSESYNHICRLCETILVLVYEFQKKVSESDKNLIAIHHQAKISKEVTRPLVELPVLNTYQTSSTIIESDPFQMETEPMEHSSNEIISDLNASMPNSSMSVPSCSGQLQPTIIKLEPQSSGEINALLDTGGPSQPLNQESGTRTRQTGSRLRPTRMIPSSRSHQESIIIETSRIGRKQEEIATIERYLIDIREKNSTVRKCKACDAQFDSKILAFQHVRYKHLRGEADLKYCELCDYATPKRFNLRQHMKRHQRRMKTMQESPAL